MGGLKGYVAARGGGNDAAEDCGVLLSVEGLLEDGEGEIAYVAISADELWAC